MSQKDIFEKVYNIVLLRGSERAISTINSMYDCYVKSNETMPGDVENATYLKNELTQIFNETQIYRDEISYRGITEADSHFYDRQKISKDLLVQDLSIVEKEDTVFYDKRVVLTGIFSRYAVRDDLASSLKKLGADLNTTISKKTDIVCLGWSGVGPSKMAKIEELKASGIDIMIIEEQELYTILDKIK